MIVVDTSVWIAANREPDVARTLRELVEADEVALALPVRLELLAGTARSQRRRLVEMFSALPQVTPMAETWRPLEGWVARAADAGQHFTLADLLIASLAGEIGGLVWSLDKDFERMEKLKMVRLYG